MMMPLLMIICNLHLLLNVRTIMNATTNEFQNCLSFEFLMRVKGERNENKQNAIKGLATCNSGTKRQIVG